MRRKHRTLAHILNKLEDYCIIKHNLKIYEKEGNIIVDVYLAHFINTVKYIEAIEQISAQLTIPMINRHTGTFLAYNYFDWKVESAGKEKRDKCFIRFTIYPKRYIPFIYCNECGKKTMATYDGKQESRICPKHSLISLNDCTLTYKQYKRLPKNQRGIKFER